MTSPKPVIGLVGGIGSGKSRLALWVAVRLPTQVISADVAGHEALRRSKTKQQLREAFGDEIFGDNSQVIRERLADRVFGDDPEQQAARQRLEAIVHPLIRKSLQEDIEIGRRTATSWLILLDAPILLETGWSQLCDAVVYIDAPPEVRLERVRQSRNWTEHELQHREASQWSLERKRAAADVVIDNGGSLDDAGEQFLSWLNSRFQLRPAGPV